MTYTESKAAGRVDIMDGAKKILDAYNNLPEEKRPVLVGMVESFCAGMRYGEEHPRQAG